MSSNKFLGLDSINIIKDYINNQISDHNNTIRIVTLQAYKYVENGTVVETPQGGGFDTTGSNVIYPAGWYSLKNLNDLLIESYESLSEALSNGSIYMSAATIEGNSIPMWSAPMKVSGQNGISVRFKFTYNPATLSNEQIDGLSDTPNGVNATNRFEYIYTKLSDGEWSGPVLWATYSKNATNIVWRYCVTKTLNAPEKPSYGDSLWTSDLATQNLSKEYPYMWMCSQILPANEDGTYSELNDENWVGPILFGHYGQDGENGQDGNVPDYTITLYHKGYSDPEISDITGIIAPPKPVFVEDTLIEDYIKDGWYELPVEEKGEEGDEEVEDNSIWWQCTLKVDGKTNKVLSEDLIGDVKRYNAIDGTAKQGQFTINLYAWSESQNQPEMSETLIDGWRPSNYEYLPDRPFELTNPEASLWMITANVAGLDEDGKPIVNGSWSEPIKLTGPRGPIGYDYRIETRYNIGNENGPKELPTDEEWSKEVPSVESRYPYIWAKNYLLCYKMTYGEQDPITGEYSIVPIGNGDVIESYNHFRLSGLNGENGNRKNSLVYSTEESNIVSVESFSANNLYISNSENDITYLLELDKLSFINGYTAKFANIGTGLMIINGGEFKLVGSRKEAESITLEPQESVELVCYNNADSKELLVIGKSLN